MTDRICTVDGCDDEHAARGLCRRHWQAAKADGTLHLHEPARPRTSPGAMVVHVADLWGLVPSDLIGPDDEHAAARVDLIHRLRDELGLPVKEIAHVVGGRGVHQIRYALGKIPLSPPPDAQPVPDDGMCTVAGCGRDHGNHTGVRMCSGHRARWRRDGDIRADKPLRPLRPDDAPVLELEVHDRTGYRNGCRCDECRADAVRAVKLHRHRPGSTDAARGARAVRRLQRQGMSVPQIASAAGLTNSALYAWLHGRTARALLTSIEAVEAVHPSPTGTVEQLHASTCADCDAPSFAGGRWCWDHYQAHRRQGAA